MGEKYRLELIGSTVSRAVGVWPPEPLQVNAAPGLYLTRGDGVAVEVTAEMLASAAYKDVWADFSEELRAKLTLQAQKLIDGTTEGASYD